MQGRLVPVSVNVRVSESTLGDGLVIDFKCDVFMDESRQIVIDLALRNGEPKVPKERL